MGKNLDCGAQSMLAASAPPPLPDDKWVAEADLQPNQIQDLAGAIGDLLGAAAGDEIKFHLRVELEENASPQVKQSVNSTFEGFHLICVLIKMDKSVGDFSHLEFYKRLVSFA